jgi:hypothetical protein
VTYLVLYIENFFNQSGLNTFLLALNANQQFPEQPDHSFLVQSRPENGPPGHTPYRIKRAANKGGPDSAVKELLISPNGQLHPPSSTTTNPPHHTPHDAVPITSARVSRERLPNPNGINSRAPRRFPRLPRDVVSTIRTDHCSRANSPILIDEHPGKAEGKWSSSGQANQYVLPSLLSINSYPHLHETPFIYHPNSSTKTIEIKKIKT